jgi:hypothetical protein
MLMSLHEIASALGGEVSGDEVKAPSPGHSVKDRGMSVKLDASAPDGFLVHSFNGIDDIACKDYVREKLGQPPWQPKGKSKSKAKPAYNPSAKYTYRQADGTPYLQVHRFNPKAGFPQYHWTGNQWLKNAPKGPKIPYRLPELLAAPLSTDVHLTEGEQDADTLAALGFVATCNSEGADTGTGGKFTADLIPYFKDRNVLVHQDNDANGRAHTAYVCRILKPVAASVKLVRLPGLKEKGDVSDFLKGDPSGVRFIQECKKSPLWEPSAVPDSGEPKLDVVEDFVALEFAEQQKSDFRYIAETDRWMVWNETHWKSDKILTAYRTARTLCRQYAKGGKAKTIAVSSPSRSRISGSSPPSNNGTPTPGCSTPRPAPSPLRPASSNQPTRPTTSPR